MIHSLTFFYFIFKMLQKQKKRQERYRLDKSSSNQG